MKKPAIIIVCLCVILMNNQTSRGQAGASVVTDPASYAYLSQSVASASESAEKLGQSLKYLKEAKEAFDKVNGALQTGERLRYIILSQQYMMQNTKNSYRSLEASRQFSPAELAYIMGSFSSLISRSQNDLEFAKNLGKDGIFKMNDNERIIMLNDVQEKSSVNSHESYYLDQKYQRMRQKKEVINTFSPQSSTSKYPSENIK